MSKQAISLSEASSQYVNDSSLTGLSISTEKVVMTGGFKGANSGLDSIFALTDTTGSRSFIVLWINSNKLECDMGWSSGGNQGLTATTSSDYNDGEWHTYVLTIENVSSRAKITLDIDNGSEIVTSTHASLSFNFNGAMDYLSFGATKNWFNGSIQHYFTGKISSHTLSVDDVEKGRWEFAGDLTDSNANGNNLTNNNSVTFVNDNPLTDISLYGDVEGTDYVKMTINSSEVDATLTNYPVYLDLSQIDSSDNFWSTVSSDGSDIIVTNADGTIQYALEVVDIDTVGKTGEAHFKIPSLSSSADTDIRVYYDGTQGARDVDALYGRNEVWSDYARVYHMTASGTTVTDSTGNTDGTKKSSTEPTSTTGFLANAQDFDGVDGHIDIGGDSTVQIGANDFEITTWVNFDTFSSASGSYDHWFWNGWSYNNSSDELSHLIAVFDPNSSRQIRMLASESGGTVNVVSDTTARTTGTDYKVTAGYDGTNLTLKVNDEAVNTVNIGAVTHKSVSATDPILLGGRIPTTSFEFTLDGKMGESRMRLSHTGDSWHSTEYNNQSSPATFWTYNTPPLADQQNAVFFGCNF